jgi:alpha-1,3/alpha-1,6-mannosyltransferase
MRVAFLHPELGIGGAERLVIDAALELEARGHETVIFTAAHDPGRAFAPTVDGRLDVQLRGAALPARVAGRLRVPCAAARVGWLGVAAALDGRRFDALVVDLVPYALPLLRRLPLGGARLVYYCHFPDQLLALERRGILRPYRAVIDRLEVPALRAADRVAVNSRFTGETLARLGLPGAEVVYPGVDVDLYAALPEPPAGEVLLLSIARFDPRKNLALAIDALGRLRERLAPAIFAGVRLVLAGGFDPGLPEDHATADALVAHAARLGLAERVELRRSPSDAERLALLAACRAVIFTPPEEHFGLVPVEAMAAGRPVVAAASGGPLETVLDGETGALVAPTADAFAAALVPLVEDRALAARLGRGGRRHAARFSRRAFGDALEALLVRCVA